MDPSKFWVPGTPATHAYFESRQQLGGDPFPRPQTEREEIVHKLWYLGIGVAGWWLEETSVLRDMLHKYEVTQMQEAEMLLKKKQDRAARMATGPTKKQISERLRDVYGFNQAKKAGRKRVYQASGTEALT